MQKISNLLIYFTSLHKKKNYTHMIASIDDKRHILDILFNQENKYLF